jgi:hypothetical protein
MIVEVVKEEFVVWIGICLRLLANTYSVELYAVVVFLFVSVIIISVVNMSNFII